MSAYTSYRAINSWVVDKVKEFIPKKRILAVYEGEKASLPDLPHAYVIPRAIVIVDTTVANVQWQCTFDIVFVDKEPDIAVGQQRILELGWDCYDKLMVDRQMGGLAELYPRRIEPDYEETPEFTLHWILVRFEAQSERIG